MRIELVILMVITAPFVIYFIWLFSPYRARRNKWKDGQTREYIRLRSKIWLMLVLNVSARANIYSAGYEVQVEVYKHGDNPRQPRCIALWWFRRFNYMDALDQPGRRFPLHVFVFLPDTATVLATEVRFWRDADGTFRCDEKAATVLRAYDAGVPLGLLAATIEQLVELARFLTADEMAIDEIELLDGGAA